MNTNKILHVLFFIILAFSTRSYANEIGNMAISSDKQWLALSYADFSIKIYSLENGQVLQTLKGHSDEAYSMDFNIDGTRLISTDGDGTAILWDLKSGEMINQKSLSGMLVDSYFSANNNIVLFFDEKAAQVYNSKLKKIIKTLSVGGDSHVSDDKRFLLGVMRNREGVREGVEVIDLSNNGSIMELKPVDAYDDDIVFNHDKSIVVVRDWDYFHFWNIENKRKIGVIKSTSRVDSFALRDGTDELWIASDNQIEVWNFITQKMEKRILLTEMDVDEVKSISFSKDNTKIAMTFELESKRDQSKVVLLDAQTNAVKSILEPSRKQYVFEAIFLDNDRILMSSSYPQEVWSTGEAKKLFSIEG